MHRSIYVCFRPEYEAASSVRANSYPFALFLLTTEPSLRLWSNRIRGHQNRKTVVVIPLESCWQNFRGPWTWGFNFRPPTRSRSCERLNRLEGCCHYYYYNTTPKYYEPPSAKTVICFFGRRFSRWAKQISRGHKDKLSLSLSLSLLPSHSLGKFANHMSSAGPQVRSFSR